MQILVRVCMEPDMQGKLFVTQNTYTLNFDCTWVVRLKAIV